MQIAILIIAFITITICVTYTLKIKKLYKNSIVINLNDEYQARLMDLGYFLGEKSMYDVIGTSLGIAHCISKAKEQSIYQLILRRNPDKVLSFVLNNNAKIRAFTFDDDMEKKLSILQTLYGKESTEDTLACSIQLTCTLLSQYSKDGFITILDEQGKEAHIYLL